jgi:pimeloyl-ACP methyl ester carboxylesterase
MNDAVVIFVHGLWMNGLELTWMRRQVAKQGYTTAQFTYSTVRRSIDENAVRLHDFVLRQSAPSVHFVGYSLGGLVTLRLLETYSDIPRGRVVLMGSPVRGSQVAGRLREIGWDGPLLGRSGLHESRDVQWDGRRDLGVIAGTRNIGLGNLIKRLPKPNDGTVAVQETEIPGATDALRLPVTHASMMFSRDVAGAIAGFLRNGTF